MHAYIRNKKRTLFLVKRSLGYFTVTILCFGIGFFVARIATGNSLEKKDRISKEETEATITIHGNEIKASEIPTPQNGYSPSDINFLDETQTAELLAYEEVQGVEVEREIQSEEKKTVEQQQASELVQQAIVEQLPEATISQKPAYACPVSVDRKSILVRVDREFGLDYYIPDSLVPVLPLVPTKHNRELCMQENALAAYRRMYEAAKTDGITIIMTSGFRDPQTQAYLYQKRRTNTPFPTVAPPSHSEHQLGTTVDLTSPEIGYTSAGRSFGDTAASDWMQNNAHIFGFTLSYPEGKENIIGYMYEPWHWRYIGPAMATLLHDRGITLTEFYLENETEENPS